MNILIGFRQLSQKLSNSSFDIGSFQKKGSQMKRGLTSILLLQITPRDFAIPHETEAATGGVLQKSCS